jgi:hypothetical protein
MRFEGKDSTRVCERDSSHGYNLVKGNVNLNVANPKAKTAVGSNIDTSDKIVPEPSDTKKISNGNGNDSPVCTNGDGNNQH